MVQGTMVDGRRRDTGTDAALRMAPQSRNRIVLQLSVGFIATMLALLTLGSLA